jgi:TRAP-type C4-dicarboxylate transport system permease large subunit
VEEKSHWWLKAHCPIITLLGFGMTQDDLKIWFGMIVLIVVEVGLITPPVGLPVSRAV